MRRIAPPLFGAALAFALAAAPAFAAEPRIKADSRFDLVGLLERLSGDPAAARNPVSDAAAARFARWKDRPAIALLARLRETGFAGNAPAQYAAYLSSGPVWSEGPRAPDFFARLAGGRNALDAWRGSLADFVQASGFDQWESSRAAEREEELAAVRAAAGGRDLAQPLTRYLGLRSWASWTVVVSPFFPKGGGASWVVEEKPGRPDVIVVHGLYWPRQGLLRRASMSGGSPEKFAESAWPEAAFSTAYALYEVCRPALKPVPDVCRGMAGLTNAEDCIQQIWVRGIVARLTESEYGAEAAAAYRAQWASTPFQVKVDAALRAYEAGRASQPDLMSAAGALFAPFQADGKAPACRLVDKTRWGETVYTQRLAYYLEGRLEARPDAELEAVRAELAARRGRER